MPDPTRNRLRRTTIFYWLLLVYIIAALVWWFISLNDQNNRMHDFEIANLQSKKDSALSPILFQQQNMHIAEEHKTNKSKYIGEGSIFLMVILLGAVFVYRSIRRQFTLQRQQQNFMMA